jgi:hypothetical protein
MCVNYESVSNEIDESKLQDEKHDKPRIGTFPGIVIEKISAFSSAELLIRVTSTPPAGEGKKTDEGTMMLPSAHESNPATVAESPQTQTLTPATTNKSQTS